MSFGDHDTKTSEECVWNNLEFNTIQYKERRLKLEVRLLLDFVNPCHHGEGWGAMSTNGDFWTISFLMVTSALLASRCSEVGMLACWFLTLERCWWRGLQLLLDDPHVKHTHYFIVILLTLCWCSSVASLLRPFFFTWWGVFVFSSLPQYVVQTALQVSNCTGIIKLLFSTFRNTVSHWSFVAPSTDKSICMGACATHIHTWSHTPYGHIL